MAFEIVVYSYNGMLYSNENEQILAVKNTDESLKHKPGTNEYILYSISRESSTDQNNLGC